MYYSRSNHGQPSRSRGHFIRLTGSLGVAFAMTVAATLSGCDRSAAHAEGAGAAPPQRPPAPVSAVAAITKDVPVYLDAIGKTVAVQSVAILPQVAGKIIAAHVQDGAYVTKGQLLFEIDPRPFEASLASANATLAQNQAEYTWTEADFKRTQELLPTNVVSQLEFDQKKSNLGVSQAKIEAAKAAILSAQLNLEYTKIFSPIDGRAGVVLIDAGNVVKANEGTLLYIQQLDPIYAEFTVTENDLGSVRKYLAARGMKTGDESQMGLRVLVDVPGDSLKIRSALGAAPTSGPATRAVSESREGTLTFLDNTVQSSTGTIKLRASLANNDRYFWPGQFVNVRVILTTRKDAVLIPNQAQQIGQQGPYVYVVGPDQTVQQRPIKVGQTQGDLLVIESGVNAGEQVVTVGQMMIQPGAKVQVIPSANTAAAGPKM